jgi:hypothetical protein
LEIGIDRGFLDVTPFRIRHPEGVLDAGHVVLGKFGEVFTLPAKTGRIYTGVLAMYAGVMLVSGEIHALLAFLIIAVAYWRKLRLEEKILSTNFGPDWDSWRRKTWALVPPLI